MECGKNEDIENDIHINDTMMNIDGIGWKRDLKMAARFALFLLLCLGSSLALKEDLLMIHVVAHSHDDTGWLRAIDDYFVYEVDYILDTVISALEENPERKFIEVEMAFFSRWWALQDERMKSRVHKLVENGQLEFTMGGWCMNDEATTHYDHIIEQMTLGHQFILHNFGVVPKTGWSIDPFGSSAMTPHLGYLFGFDGYVINRIDYRLKDQFKKDKGLEFLWRGSKSIGEKTQVFTHILDSHYGTPDGFSWEHGISQNLPDGDGDPVIIDVAPSHMTKTNVDKRAKEFVAMAKERADWFRAPHVLIPFGGDFNFQNAFMVYKNLDKLIRYINKHSEELGARVKYSTPSEYIRDVLASGVEFDVRQEDFFPYADNSKSYWTGYFTSRPAQKHLVRQAMSLLRATEPLIAAIHVQNKVALDKELHSKTNRLRNAVSVFQHHDGVTGTERDYVSYDYERRMQVGMEDVDNILSNLVGELLNNNNKVPQLKQVTPEIIDKIIQAGRLAPVVFYNALSWKRSQHVAISIPKGFDSLQVLDSEGNVISSQLHTPVKSSHDEIYFLADLPPLGVAVYFIGKTQSNDEMSIKPTPKIISESNKSINNGILEVTVDEKTGRISKVEHLETNTGYAADHHFYQYEPTKDYSQSSGAYIFRPDANHPHADPLENPSKVTIEKGPCFDQITQTFTQGRYRNSTESAEIWHTVRLYHGSLDKEASHSSKALHTVAFIDPLATVFNLGSEVVTRWSTDIDSEKEFETDANGLEMQKRIRNDGGRDGDADAGVAVAGNFYPIVTQASIRDQSKSGRQMTLLVDRAVAGSSLHDGELELMLHRRLLRDDSRGVGQPLNDDNSTTASVWVVFESVKENSFVSRHLSVVQNSPIVARIAIDGVSSVAEWNILYNSQFSLLQKAFPSNVHLLSLSIDPYHTKSGFIFHIRLQHILEKGDHPEFAKDVIIDLKEVFGEAPKTIKEETLTLNQPLSMGKIDGSKITLHPMDIRAFALEF